MTKEYSSSWWCDYKDTPEQYQEILNHHPDIGTQNLTHIIIDFHYNLKEARAEIETLKGRIYELEQTLDGRENDFGLTRKIDPEIDMLTTEEVERLDRSQWAWAEKEED